MNSTNLDKVVNRRGTNSAKWDTRGRQFGKDDLLHLGVADMDFQSSPAIIEAIKEIAEQGILGYTDLNDEFYESIIDWYKEKKKIDIEKEWIVFCPRINIAAGICVNVLTKPTENVILNTPVYTPLKQAVLANNREIISNVLIYDENNYHMDFQQLEQLITSETRLMIVTNPDNPTGRVWKKEELMALHHFCEKHDLYIFSDEIHSGIVKEGVEFTSILATTAENQQRIICADSITKTFNVPGAIISYLIIPNKAVREAVECEIDRIGMHNPNIFSLPILEAAYRKSDDWLKAVNEYIDQNEQLVRSFCQENFPELKICKREGTYLLWINYEALEISEEALMHWFIEVVGVDVYPGSQFGEEGHGFFRMVIACSKQTVLAALEKMKQHYQVLKLIDS